MITLCVPNTQVKQICAQQLFCCAQICTTNWHIKICAQIFTKKTQKRSKIFSSNLKSHSGVFNQCIQAKTPASHTATLNIFLPDLRRINRFTIDSTPASAWHFAVCNFSLLREGCASAPPPSLTQIDTSNNRFWESREEGSVRLFIHPYKSSRSHCVDNGGGLDKMRLQDVSNLGSDSQS